MLLRVLRMLLRVLHLHHRGRGVVVCHFCDAIRFLLSTTQARWMSQRERLGAVLESTVSPRRPDAQGRMRVSQTRQTEASKGQRREDNATSWMSRLVVESCQDVDQHQPQFSSLPPK